VHALKKNVMQGPVTHPPRGPQKMVIAKTGHVNYTAMEDILEGECNTLIFIRI
jgi:hypothetical protein